MTRWTDPLQCLPGNTPPAEHGRRTQDPDAPNERMTPGSTTQQQTHDRPAEHSRHAPAAYGWTQDADVMHHSTTAANRAATADYG